MAMPSLVRPQRPARWRAEAWLIGSIGSRCTLVRWLYREMRAVPGSMTYLMPGTVRDVSATLVARTAQRTVCGSKTRGCSAVRDLADGNLVDDVVIRVVRVVAVGARRVGLQGPVADFDRIGAAGDLDDRGLVEV